MKKNIILPVIFLISVSCVKNNHKVRVQNNTKETVKIVTIGSSNIENIPSGESSDYVPVPSRSFMITGHTESNENIIGSEKVTGIGKHKWTISISTRGELSIAED